MDGRIVEDQPEIEKHDAKFFLTFSERVRQHGRREIASETKQQIMHRERGKAE
jgi:hypothetical protein